MINNLEIDDIIKYKILTILLFELILIILINKIVENSIINHLM
jgi:hypothetical protein